MILYKLSINVVFSGIRRLCEFDTVFDAENDRCEFPEFLVACGGSPSSTTGETSTQGGETSTEETTTETTSATTTTVEEGAYVDVVRCNVL